MLGRHITMKAVTFVLLCLLSCATHATEVNWVPNEDADDVSLPMSMKQRQQLLQLQQAIQSAPDPEKVLLQVAEANQMSPQDLVNMIDRNARDLAQDPSLAQPKSLPKQLFKLMGTAAVALNQAARKHPKAFALIVTCCVATMYSSFAIPRSGLVLSSGSGILSKGPTTLCEPPAKYLHKLASLPKMQQRTTSIKAQKVAWDDLQLDGDGVESISMRDNKELAQAVVAQLSLDSESLLVDYDLDDDTMSDMMDQVTDLLFENAIDILELRQLTEFVPPSGPKGLRYVTSDDEDKQHGVLAARGFGDLGLYGTVFFRVTKETLSDSESSITLCTLKGGNAFDGQLRISCLRSDDGITVQTHLVVPRKGRKLSAAKARSITDGITSSVVESIRKRSAQILARRSQSSRFKGSGHNKAAERRRSRFLKEKEIEEMAADRRRRWQRQNPDAGRYRPSGVRQQSPNNC